MAARARPRISAAFVPASEDVGTGDGDRRGRATEGTIRAGVGTSVYEGFDNLAGVVVDVVYKKSTSGGWIKLAA